MTYRSMSLCLVLALAMPMGCGTEEEDPPNNPPPPPTVACMDAAILELNLQVEPAPGGITNTDTAGEWLSEVDATAGGAFAADPDSFVYAAFTDQGLTKAPLGDEDAFTNPNWDIAFRRYVIRVNSGNSGIGSTVVARMPVSADFDTLTLADVPTSVTYRQDEYFATDCSFISDGSGLEDSPAAAMSGYYSYVLDPGCVQMTNTVYVVRTAAGRHVKVMVTHYYNEEYQQYCQDESSSFSPMGAGSANFQLRWELLD